MKKLIVALGFLLLISSSAFAGEIDSPGDYVCYFSNFVRDASTVTPAIQDFLNKHCDKSKPFAITMASGEKTGSQACCIQK